MLIYEYEYLVQLNYLNLWAIICIFFRQCLGIRIAGELVVNTCHVTVILSSYLVLLYVLVYNFHVYNGRIHLCVVVCCIIPRTAAPTKRDLIYPFRFIMPMSASHLHMNCQGLFTLKNMANVVFRISQSD